MMMITALQMKKPAQQIDAWFFATYNVLRYVPFFESDFDLLLLIIHLLLHSTICSKWSSSTLRRTPSPSTDLDFWCEQSQIQVNSCT